MKPVGGRVFGPLHHGTTTRGRGEGGRPLTHPPAQLQGSGRRSTGGPAQKFTMSRWLLSCVLLVLIEVGRPAALQNALEKVLEDFHGRNLVQAAFRGETAREVVEELPMGTYVQLEVDLVQTVCRKHQWRSQNCQIKAGSTRQKCLACFKFDVANPRTLVNKSLRCLSEHNPVFQEVRRRQEEECQAIKSANEDQYLPGKFAFSVGLPS
ncbi:LOW QUALITY PROTEIN: retinoic acid receptor responder protein 2 [Pituophis catenifer annectens]|uniref:LOW QUALITY PROTEIN: retinoic acid receptor responder protein 2 n=1 Tax=Pituophis catenifer annectens TaxID=94852 RepID=UPI003995D6AD